MVVDKKVSYLYAATGLLTIIATSFLIALIVVLISCSQIREPHSDHTITPPTNRNYCLTDACRRAAANLRFSINPKIDPCDDFYEYACGLWDLLHPIEEGYARRSAFSELNDQNTADLKQYMNTLEVGDGSSEAKKLLKRVYDSCMNETAMAMAKDEPLKKMMQSIFQFFPKNSSILITEFEEVEVPSLELLLARLWKEYGAGALMTLTVGADENSTTASNILNLDQPTLSLGRGSEDYYLKNETMYEKVRQAYLSAMKGVFRESARSSGQSEENIPKIVSSILEFETSIARINTPANKRQNPELMYHKMTITELSNFGGAFNWTNFMNILSPQVTEVNVIEPDYFAKLNSLLMETSKSTIYLYIEWKLAYNHLAFLESKLSDIYFEFYKKFRDQGKEKDRTRFCIPYITGEPDDGYDFLGYALGQLFVERKGFNAMSRSSVDAMVTALKASFQNLLEENVWMDEETKKQANLKIEDMISSIGYPDMVSDLSEYYGPLLKREDNYTDLVIQPEDGFFDIDLKIRAWLNQKQLNQLQKPFDRRSFGGSPATVNAWYSPTKNSIVFPAGILQPPFFIENAPAAVNFGSIGTVIGHEITHGFDDQGSQYDASGKLKNWWSSQSELAFKRRVDCVEKQYNKFCYPKLGEKVCVKGDLTKSENIADNGGIKQSYAAYKQLTAGEADQALPGLEDHTMDQIFFLSFANFWCGSMKSNYLINMIDTNEHAPSKYRVIGTLQNFDEFSKAYNCPVGSRMNSKEKCIVW